MYEHNNDLQLKHSSRPKFETIVTQVDKTLLHPHQTPHHVGLGGHAHGHGLGHGHAHQAGGESHAHGHGHCHHNIPSHSETYELSLLGANPNSINTAEIPGGKRSRTTSPEPIVDEFTYKVHTRFIAVIDIIYSCVMLVFQLGILIGGSSYRNSPDEDLDELEAKNLKMNLTIAVLIWMVMFSICIIQLVVASALYGGTNERDLRKCLRNCRMWCVVSVFLVLVLSIEVIGILISNEIVPLIFPLIILTSELMFRLIGLIIISRFIKELSFELADSANDANEIHYEPLPYCPSSPLSLHKTSNKNLPDQVSSKSQLQPPPQSQPHSILRNTNTTSISDHPYHSSSSAVAVSVASASPQHDINTPRKHHQLRHPFAETYSSPSPNASSSSHHPRQYQHAV